MDRHDMVVRHPRERPRFAEPVLARVRIDQRVSRKQLHGDVAIQRGFPGEVNHARSAPAKLALDDETGKRRRGVPSRRGLGRLRDGSRRGFEDLLAIGTVLDMSLQAREGGLADGLGPDQSEGRFRGAVRHGRDGLVSVFELISSARRRSPSSASRSTTRLWAACAAR